MIKIDVSGQSWINLELEKRRESLSTKMFTFNDKYMIARFPSGEAKIEESNEQGFFRVTVKRHSTIHPDSGPSVQKDNEEEVFIFKSYGELAAAALPLLKGMDLGNEMDILKFFISVGSNKLLCR